MVDSRRSESLSVLSDLTCLSLIWVLYPWVRSCNYGEFQKVENTPLWKQRWDTTPHVQQLRIGIFGDDNDSMLAGYAACEGFKRRNVHTQTQQILVSGPDYLKSDSSHAHIYSRTRNLIQMVLATVTDPTRGVQSHFGG